MFFYGFFVLFCFVRDYIILLTVNFNLGLYDGVEWEKVGRSYY